MSNPSRKETPAHNATTVMMSLPTGEPSTTLTASTCFPLAVTMRPSQMSFCAFHLAVGVCVALIGALGCEFVLCYATRPSLQISPATQPPRARRPCQIGRPFYPLPNSPPTI